MEMERKKTGYLPKESDRRLPALGLAALLGALGGSLLCARWPRLQEILFTGGQAPAVFWQALWPDLILLALMGKLFDHDRTIYASVTAFTFVAALFELFKTLPVALQTGLRLEGAITFARKYLPWFNLNLGWVIPAVIGFGVGMLIRILRKRK